MSERINKGRSIGVSETVTDYRTMFQLPAKDGVCHWVLYGADGDINPGVVASVELSITRDGRETGMASVENIWLCQKQEISDWLAHIKVDWGTGSVVVDCRWFEPSRKLPVWKQLTANYRCWSPGEDYYLGGSSRLDGMPGELCERALMMKGVVLPPTISKLLTHISCRKDTGVGLGIDEEKIRELIATWRVKVLGIIPPIGVGREMVISSKPKVVLVADDPNSYDRQRVQSCQDELSRIARPVVMTPQQLLTVDYPLKPDILVMVAGISKETNEVVRLYTGVYPACACVYYLGDVGGVVSMYRYLSSNQRNNVIEIKQFTDGRELVRCLRQEGLLN